MTAKGKVVLTIIILAVFGGILWRWWPQIAPKGASQSTVPSVTKQDVAQPPAAPAPADITSKLLAGNKEAKLISGAATIPAVAAASAYEKSAKNGKLVVNFPINVWPGWAPLIMANNGLSANEDSVFYKDYGFYVELSVVDDPVAARDLFASGKSHILWGTLDIIALFAPGLSADSRTAPVVFQQIDFSDGGDGVVARNGIRSINDLRPVNGVRRKGVLAQYSPSHFLIMSLLVDAGVDPADIDWQWSSDAPSAAKIFVNDKSFDFFVGWAPDIYIVSDNVAGARLIVTTERANKVVADVYAVRNDFYRDNPEVCKNLARGIFKGIDMVRANSGRAAELLASAFDIPLDDCKGMVGADGGIVDGDAHLTNYRENESFFLDPTAPSTFDTVWNRASSIYQKLGVFPSAVPASRVKETSILKALAPEYKDVRDLSQPTFRPDVDLSQLEAGGDILTKAVQFSFLPNKSNLDTSTNAAGQANADALKAVGEMAGGFGSAYIVIEGNADASRKGIVPADAVKSFSYDRASAVKNAILASYKFDPNKFKVVGNGWDKPAAGCTDNSNPEHNAKNRRVEVKVYPLEAN